MNILIYLGFILNPIDSRYNIPCSPNSILALSQLYTSQFHSTFLLEFTNCIRSITRSFVPSCLYPNYISNILSSIELSSHNHLILPTSVTASVSTQVRIATALSSILFKQFVSVTSQIYLPFIRDIS